VAEISNALIIIIIDDFPSYINRRVRGSRRLIGKIKNIVVANKTVLYNYIINKHFVNNIYKCNGDEKCDLLIIILYYVELRVISGGTHYNNHNIEVPTD